jgi:hypothetical protein
VNVGVQVNTGGIAPDSRLARLIAEPSPDAIDVEATTVPDEDTDH